MGHESCVARNVRVHYGIIHKGLSSSSYSFFLDKVSSFFRRHNSGKEKKKEDVVTNGPNGFQYYKLL